ncbi:glycosyltransferase family 39 protein [Anaerolineales bacterium HSG25]|nr:glycosyltransferase family 39 protein [Anaerolineales bacterium HSG25]
MKANLPLTAIILLYLGLSLYQLDLPGLHYDETFEAVPIIQLLTGQPVSSFRGHGITIGGQTIPFMTQDYIGALNSYAALPFIMIFGSTPTALRLMSVLVGLLTIMATYLLVSYLSRNQRVGLVAALILAVDPTFIFWNRQGIFVTSMTATIGVFATYCWMRRWHDGGYRWAMAGSFLFGLGLYAKFLFLWLIAALGALFLLYLLYYHFILKQPWLDLILFPGASHRDRTSADAGSLPARQLPTFLKWELPMSMVAFLMGALPLIIYNLQTWGTYLAITENAGTSYYGVDNTAFIDNLGQRLYQYQVLLSGAHLWYLGDIISNPLPPILFGGMLVLVLWAVGWGVLTYSYRALPEPVEGIEPAEDDYTGLSNSLPPPNLPLQGGGAISLQQPKSVSESQTLTALFPFAVIGLVILASIGTVSALWVTHFAILMPWAAMALSLGGWFCYQSYERWLSAFTRQAMLSLGLTMLVLTNLVGVVSYHRALTESGGLSTHSDAMYDLSDWLVERGSPPVAAMDWGLAAPIFYLTNGQVAPVELFGYSWQSDADLTSRMQKFIEQPDTYYLWRAPDEIIFDRSGEFKSMYRAVNLEENIEEAFYERSGRPLLGITRLMEKGTAPHPP